MLLLSALAMVRELSEALWGRRKGGEEDRVGRGKEGREGKSQRVREAVKSDSHLFFLLRVPESPLLSFTTDNT